MKTIPSLHRAVRGLVPLCWLGLSQCLPAAEKTAVTSGPPGGQAVLAIEVTDQPVVVFDWWDLWGEAESRMFSISEGHLGYPDLKHSRLNSHYQVPVDAEPKRYFRKQTITNSWLLDFFYYTTQTSQGSMSLVGQVNVLGETEFVSGQLNDVSTNRWMDIQGYNMYGPFGPEYVESTTRSGTPRLNIHPQSRRPIFDGTTVYNDGRPGAADVMGTFADALPTPYWAMTGVGWAFLGGEPVYQNMNPNSPFATAPFEWTPTKASWNSIGAGGVGAINQASFNYTLELSDEDTLAQVQARLDAARLVAAFDNIPWGRQHWIRFGGHKVDDYSSSNGSSVWLYNYHSDFATYGEVQEENAQVRVVVPEELRIPGVAYRARFVQYFYDDLDPTYTGQVKKIFEVELKEGQWESPAITPDIPAEDGTTVIEYFSMVSEPINPHPIQPQAPSSNPSADTAPLEYATTRPTIIQQDIAGGIGSRQVLDGSSTLQQIHLSDSWGASYNWPDATATWSVLPGATAQVRLWHWTNDGSPLGVWSLVSPTENLVQYFDSSTDFFFAEALGFGRATLRITININGQEVHDDIDIRTATVELAVDANRDGQIKLSSEDLSDAVPTGRPFRIWLNDDGIDELISAPNYADGVVNGANDLKDDFFPLFLDLKTLLKVLPPGTGTTYKLKQADGAVNFVYTDLTRATAFRYQDSFWGSAWQAAQSIQITSSGVALSDGFLNAIKDSDQGVLLIEGRAATTQPLQLVVEKSGQVVFEVSMPLSVGQDVLLLLHGMNSNTNTWDAFVDGPTVHRWSYVVDIRDGLIQGNMPRRNAEGVRCYRVQFGAYDMASTRTGLEGVTAANTPGYDTVENRCGDFESFEQLGQEVEDAVTLLQARHPNLRVVLLGHSRGGLAARAFLQASGPRPAKSAVVGFLTTSSPHRGSRMGRIYGWLNTHPRGHPQTDEDDWEVVDFLLSPYGQPPALDVRRPVILDVADNSQAIGTLNSMAALQNIPTGIRCAEIQYAYARFGLLLSHPIHYSVIESTGLGGPLAPQLSSAAAEFLLNGGDAGGVAFIGDGLIPRANQRFTQLSGFRALMLPARVISDREVVHIDAPKQVDDLFAQLKQVAPDLFR